MKKLLVVVEGTSEERFVRGVLKPHLRRLNTIAVLVETGRNADGEPRKGGGDWEKWFGDIRRSLTTDANRFVTTMFDLYRLPRNFPEADKHANETNTIAVADALEAAMGRVVPDERFIPNLLRHEFETLVLAALPELELQLTQARRPNLTPLKETLKTQSPEDVNRGASSAPSKRLAAAGIDYSKLAHGVPAVQEAGIAKLKSACPRFNKWVRKLENL